MTIINTNSISGISSITAQGSNGIEFYESSGVNQRLNITSAGRVNIGQASDVDHTLCVAGTDNATSLTGGHNQGIQLQNKSTTDGTYSQIEWRTSSGGRYARIAGIQDDANGNGGQLAFLTETSGGTTAEALRITSAGKVGINETAPAAELVVKQSGSTFTTQSQTVALFQRSSTTGHGAKIAIVAGNAASSDINFGDTDDEDAGLIQYVHTDNSFKFCTNGDTSSEKLRITSAGKIGIGIDDPQVKLHVQDSAASKAYFSHPTSNKTTLYIESDDTSARVGSTYLSGGSAFKPLDFLTSGETRIRINANGRVDIGDELGVEHCGLFQVIHTGGTQLPDDCAAFFEVNSDDWIMKTNFNKGSSTHYHIEFMEEGTRRGTIIGNDGANVAFTPGSDYRMKENVVDLTGAEGIDLVKNLKPRKYNWIDNRINTGEINTVNGFIAHEVEEAGIGHLVYGSGKDAVKEDGSMVIQTLDYAGMTPVLAAAIKGLISKVEDLEQRLSAAGI